MPVKASTPRTERQLAELHYKNGSEGVLMSGSDRVLDETSTDIFAGLGN